MTNADLNVYHSFLVAFVIVMMEILTLMDVLSQILLMSLKKMDC